MGRKVIRFGIVGCGLMGREFSSAAARWCHLLDQDVRPEIVGVCDPNPAALGWFKDNVPTVRVTTPDYRDLLADPNIDAIYAAVPHNLHAGLYADVIRSGKHLLGEKPFGIDIAANRAILAAWATRPEICVSCSSEIPFYPGAYAISELIRQHAFGRIIEVEAGFWHSSDLNPLKPINWKRQIQFNGEYGCMGDLGMHVLHMPLRHGWRPSTVRALLSKVVSQRPDSKGQLVPCKTWDNATLACEVNADAGPFPMILSMKRIAPGHNNTWFIRVTGTSLSAEFSTKNPKQLATLPYTPGGGQAWHVIDVPCKSAYDMITGQIFEFGFSDSILQMWAAFCDEVAHGRKGMKQPFHCATPQEAHDSHILFTAALDSHRAGQVISPTWE